MSGLIGLIIIITSIWVIIDAKKIGVKKGQVKGLGNMGPWGWFFACWLLWIVAFPLYLSKRSEFKSVNTPDAKQIKPDAVEKLGKLAEMKEKGILTEDEFNSQKKALLNLG